MLSSPIVSADPYQILGISPKSTLAQARTAYLKHVRVLHPDRFDPVKQKVEWELANQMLRDVNEAWETIQSGNANAAAANPDGDSPPAKNRKPIPKQQPSFSGSPAPIPQPTSEVHFASKRPITFSSASGELGPYSATAIIGVVFIVAGVALTFSGYSLPFFIVAVILGHVAKFTIRRNDFRGISFAVFSLWAGYICVAGIGIYYAVAVLAHLPRPSRFIAPPSSQVANNQAQIDELNNELSQIDNDQQQATQAAENNLDNSVALLKVGTSGLQTKIADETKSLADLQQKAASMTDGDDKTKMATEIAGIQAELKTDTTTLSDQTTFLNKPRDQQISQLDAQVAAQYDERRHELQDKLAKLQK